MFRTVSPCHWKVAVPASIATLPDASEKSVASWGLANNDVCWSTTLSSKLMVLFQNRLCDEMLLPPTRRTALACTPEKMLFSATVLAPPTSP